MGALATKVSGAAARLRGLLRDCRPVQERVLAEVLERNASCEYGRRHGFASIRDPASFRDRVPPVDAEALRPALARMAAGETDVLLSGPLLAFEQTGGTSSGAKLVPYNEASLAAFRGALLPWLDDLHCAHPGLADGTAYWSVSPAGRAPGRTRGGTPLGLESDAAYLGDDLAPDLAATFSVPSALAALRDIEAWRHLTVQFLLADQRLALVSIWSPTFLLELLRHAREHAASLAEAIASGVPGRGLAAELPAHLRSRAPDPRRAAQVSAALAGAGAGAPGALWPNLRVISCWDHAASRPYAEQLRAMFPGVAVQGKGLLATEGVVSLPLHGHDRPVLAIESGFFEFRGDDGDARFAHQLSEGEDYDLLITNHSGLYRYAIGDRVRVTGFAGNTPLVEFMGRSGAVSDLCGEKLCEAFALRALRPFGLRFAALAGEADGDRGYVLLLDAAEISAAAAGSLALEVDARLGENPQYAHARRLRQLGPLRVARCERPLQSWLDAGMRRGARLGDIKPGALYLGADWRERFVPEP